MRPDSARDLAILLIGAATLASGAAVPGLAEAATGAAGVLARLTGRRRSTAERLVAEVQRSVEQAWREWEMESAGHDLGALRGAVASFHEVVPHIDVRQSDVVVQRLDPDAIAKVVLDRAVEARPSLYRDHRHAPEPRLAREFLLTVVRHGYARLLQEPDFVERIAPELWREALGKLDDVRADTTTLLSGQEEMHARLKRVEALLLHGLEERGEAQTARASGVTDAALIELARRIAADVTNVDQAMVELKRAVEVAIRVQEGGHHGSNLGGFVDEVLRRTAALSARGEYEAVSDDLDAAMAEADARARAIKSRLLDSHIVNDGLRRDPAAAARHVIARLANDGRHSSAEIFAAFVEWRDSGLRGPLIFDLEVSVHLAGEALTRSRDTFERAHVQENIGLVRETLGHRLLRRDLYDAAHEDFQAAAVAFNHPLTQDRRVMALHHGLQNRSRAAVLEREHKKLPRIAAAMERLLHEARPWPRIEAAIWSAFGTTLVELGCHERETINPRVAKPRFEKAIGCYEASLRLVRKDQDRQKWARDVQNLGRALFEAERYEEALGQYRQALRTKRRRADPLSWGVTVFNIAAAWAKVAQRDWSEAAFLKARCWARIALRVRSRDASRWEWAVTTRLLGMLEAQRRQMTGDTASVDEARRLLTEVRPVLEEFQSPRELAEVDRILTELAAPPTP